ncbi:ion channel [Anthocerotibacter panamensis]|uniref:ion channel n=1 Tax=Anthocerotibacter panamensis TaxID=2857077 RepID=UPI001C401A7C|nr:ion channel [Anthocerotibacter panamensis]
MAKIQRPYAQSRFVNRSGKQLEFVRLGEPISLGFDLYHGLLRVSWPWFLVLVSVGYIAINTLFALAYLAGGDDIAGGQPGSFADAFFFSVQTLGTLGYGVLSPRTFYTNVVVCVEVFVGLLGSAVATGLLFARFSRPTARVLFSNMAVITLREGMPTLMFRAANQRRNQILEANLQVTLLMDEYSREGQFMRRFYDLKLVRGRSPIFALTWTAMHVIDETSPLYSATPESLRNIQAELIVTLTGIDETVYQTIHARHSFVTEEILWNMRFVDIVSQTPDGQRTIDFSRFHEVVSDA